MQRGLIPIPKSVKKEHIEQNINIFDFEMSHEEMEELSKSILINHKIFFRKISSNQRWHMSLYSHLMLIICERIYYGIYSSHSYYVDLTHFN